MLLPRAASGLAALAKVLARALAYIFYVIHKLRLHQQPFPQPHYSILLYQKERTEYYSCGRDFFIYASTQDIQFFEFC